MKAQLPVLLLLIPFFSAILMPLVSLRRPRWCGPIALGVAIAMSVLAVVNLVLVVGGGETRYAFGGWAAPLGIEWVADALASVVMVAVGLIATIALVNQGTVRLEAGPGRVSLHYVLILLLLSGLTGVVFAADLFNIFVFVEVIDPDDVRLDCHGGR